MSLATLIYTGDKRSLSTAKNNILQNGKRGNVIQIRGYHAILLNRVISRFSFKRGNRSNLIKNMVTFFNHYNYALNLSMVTIVTLNIY